MISSKLTRFSISKARKMQMDMAKKIVTDDRLPNRINLVAGVDVAYTHELAVGAVVILDYATLEEVEFHTATDQVRFPYIPTLLSFREIPVIMACIKKVNQQPDVFLVDGQGIAHPFRCGFASHLGLLLGKPTIGVAKSRLIGENTVIGKDSLLVENGQIVGAQITTKEKLKPIYVSIGHLVSLETAIKVVRQCIRHTRIPEPILKAHKLASKERKLLKNKQKLSKFNSKYALRIIG